MQYLRSPAVLLLSSVAAAMPQGQAESSMWTIITITSPLGLPSSCTFRPTQTVTATTGCPTPCSTYANNCWWDNALELECGCLRMSVEPVTQTVCPTVTNCMQCTTGWGIVTITPTACPTPTPTPL